MIVFNFSDQKPSKAAESLRFQVRNLACSAKLQSNMFSGSLRKASISFCLVVIKAGSDHSKPQRKTRKRKYWRLQLLA